jgi:hypothetical protein
MDEQISVIIFSIILLITTIISGLFFSLTGIKLESFLTINLFPVLDKFLTIEFLLFILFASITLSMILFIIKKFNLKMAIIITSIGYIVGLVITTILFGLTLFLIPLSFGLIGIIISIFTQDKKEKEYKSMPLLRSGINSSGKIIFFIAVGFLLFTLIITVGNKSDYEQNFSKDVLSLTIGDNGTLQDSVSKPIINSIIESQKQTITNVKNLSGYSELSEKNDIDILTFIANLDGMEAMINSEEYKSLILEQLEKEQKNTDLGKTMLDNLPLINQISIYTWLIYPLLLFMIILGIGNLIVKNLAGIIYYIISLYSAKQNFEENLDY